MRRMSKCMWLLFLMVLPSILSTSCQNATVSTDPKIEKGALAAFTSPQLFGKVWTSTCPLHHKSWAIELTLSKEASKHCTRVTFMYAVPDRVMTWHEFAVVTPYNADRPMTRIGLLAHRLKNADLHGQTVIISALVELDNGDSYDVEDLPVVLDQIGCEHTNVEDFLTTVSETENTRINYSDIQ